MDKVKRLFKFFVLSFSACLFLSLPCLEAADPPSLLVLPFKNLSLAPNRDLSREPELVPGSEQGLDWLGESIAGGLNRYLEPVEGLRVISRQRLQEVLKPSNIHELRVLEAAQVREFAQQLGARWVVFGSYQRGKTRRHLVLSAYLIEADSDKPPLPLLEVNGRIKQLFDWQRQTVVKLLDHLKMKADQDIMDTVPTSSLLAYEYYYSSWEPFLAGEDKDALHWCQKAMITDRKYEAPVVRMAVLYERMEQPEEAVKVYLRLQSLWQESDRIDDMQKLHDKLGLLYLELGEYNPAMKSFQRSLEILEKEKETEETEGTETEEKGKEKGKDLVALADVYAKIALTHCHKKEYANGVKYYEKVLKIQKKLGDKRAIAGAYNKIGDIYYRKGLDINAVRQYKKAFAVWKKLDDKHGLAITHNKLGVAHSQGKRRKKALKAFSNALRLAEGLGDNSLMAQIYMNMGELYFVDIRYDRAMECFRNALALQEDMKQRRTLADIYKGIGKVHRRENRSKHALEYFQKALVLQRELRLEVGEAETLEELAGVYFKQKEYDLAVEYFNKALSLQAMLGNRQQLAYIHKSLGAIYARQGFYRKALPPYLKALEMERSLQDLVGQAGTYYGIAKIYEKMQQYEKAINYIKKTVAIDRKTNDPNLRSDKRYLQQLQEQLKTRMATGSAPPEESAIPPPAPTP